MGGRRSRRVAEAALTRGQPLHEIPVAVATARKVLACGPDATLIGWYGLSPGVPASGRAESRNSLWACRLWIYVLYFPGAHGVFPSRPEIFPILGRRYPVTSAQLGERPGGPMTALPAPDLQIRDVQR